MTEAEALELIPIYVDVAVTSFSMYLTMTFGYFTVAYLVGAKLSRFQMLAISSLYLYGAGGSAVTAFIQIQAWAKIKEEYTTILDEFAFWNAEFWLISIPGLTVAGIFLGLYFMWNIREGSANDS
ncbi:MAG: hypothetical protein ACI9BW_002375 [Gammaproteobacteria bacterium]